MINPATGKEETEEEARARARAQFPTLVQPPPDLSVLRDGGGVNMMGPSTSAPIDPTTGAPAGMALPQATPFAGADAGGFTPEQRARLAANETAMGLDQPFGQSSAPDRARDGASAFGAQVGAQPPSSQQPQQQTPGVPPIAPMQGGKHVEGGISTTETTRTKLSPEYKAGAAREQAALDAGVGIAQREGEVGKKLAQGELDTATRQQDADEQQLAAQRKVTAEFSQKLSAQEKIYNQAVDDRSRMSIEKFGEGDPTWKGIGRTLVVGLGELGASLSKSGHNTALEIINQQAQEHYMLQKEKLAEGDRKVAQARQGMQDINQNKISALLDIERENAAWNKALASQARKTAAAVGTEHAAVLGEQIANAADQRAAQHATETGKLLNVQVHSENRTSWTNQIGGAGAGGMPGGGRAAGFMMEQGTMGVQMQEDMKGIVNGPELTAKDWARIQDNQTKKHAAEQAHGGIGTAIALAGRGAGIVPRSDFDGLPPEKQKAANSWDLLATKAASVLSRSGAQGSIQELKSQFLPSPNDSPVAVAQKFAHARTMAAVAMQNSGQYGINAQAAAERADVSGPSLPAAAAGETKQFRDKQTGKVVLARQGPDGQWHEIQ